ncbi:MAG: class I SAM-dependent methyltransferase [Nanoarchaeota archaeon]
MTNPWWSNSGGFFGTKYLEGDNSLEGYLPERTETIHQRTTREVDGIIKLLDLKKGSRILDCPCGYGRHSNELASRGMVMFGVDINRDFLKVAEEESIKRFNPKEKVHWKPPMPVFMHGDMRDIPGPSCENIINMFYSFGFFETDEENEKVMDEFWWYLPMPEGGNLLIHTDVSPEIITSGRYRFSETRNLKSGKRLRIEESYNPHTKRMNGSWTIIQPDGKEEKLTPYSVRIYSQQEFEEMAKKVGFKETKFYGSFNGEEFKKDSPEMIMVAKK